MYCGVEPAALYESRDDGETFSLVRGLYDHPHRPRWMPGLGGLTLHTIVLDAQNPQRMYVAISAGGVYATEDGGRTWQARNRGIRVVHMPEKYPEFDGQCVHKVVMHPARPERLFLQNHWGLYRSDRGAQQKDAFHGAGQQQNVAVPDGEMLDAAVHGGARPALIARGSRLAPVRRCLLVGLCRPGRRSPATSWTTDRDRRGEREGSRSV